MLIYTLFLMIISTSYILSDTRYMIPNCIMNNSFNNNIPDIYHLPNQFGTMNIESDLLVSNLTITINFTNIPLYSCYLCDKLPSNIYCNNTLKTNDVSLAEDLSFNLIIITVKESDNFPTHISPFQTDSYHFEVIPSNGGGSTNIITFPIINTTWENKPINCNETLKLLIIPIVSITYPMPIDFLTMVNNYIENPSHIIECNDNNRIFDSISCITLRNRYYYITYTTPNCIAMINENDNNTNSYDIYNNLTESSLIWYYRALNGELNTSILDNIQLCGQDWLSILINSNLTLLCNKNGQIYSKFKPWYMLAIQMITTNLNIKLLYNVHIEDRKSIQSNMIQFIGFDILLAYNTLQLSCKERDTLQTTIEMTFFNDIYQRLYQFNNEEEENVNIQSICLLYIAPLLSINKTEMISGVLPLFGPIYLNYYKEWYFYPFNIVIPYYYSINMKISVIALLVFFALAAMSFIIFMFILPLWMFIVNCYKNCRRSQAQRRYDSTNMILIPYDEHNNI